ncbi:MAG: SoxR reducing system RseC family protein [Mariprofundaceae bacterium]|nr:SoxR reducing system RseC family protein [Mariprofundaceae bacterium]
MQKQGVVIEVVADHVVIRSEKESSCGSCAGKASCGTLGSWDIAKKQKNQIDITLPNTLQAQVGDVVTVEVPDNLILKASMMFYGLPVLAFLLLGGLSFVLADAAGWSGDLFSALGGSSGAMFIWIWLMQRPNTMPLPVMVNKQG